nr:unnamed protein product [Callosobruchus chinensis]
MRNSNDDENVEKNTVANEMDFYLKSNRLDRKADPYKWWSANEKQCPNLSKFAKVYLSSPGSRVYSERLFSEAGIIYDEKHFLCSFVTNRPLNVTTDLDRDNIAVSTQNSEINLDGTPSSPLPQSSTLNTTSAILTSIESVDTIAKCTSFIHGEPVAGSSRDQTQIQCTFSPEIIRPYPKAGARNTKIKRRTRNSAILTDTPEKDALALEQSSKKRQKTERGAGEACR